MDLKNPDFSSSVADIASAVRGIPKDELASEEVRQHRRTIRTAWAAGIALAALATVATLLRRLEERGLVTHRSEGRQFVYSALLSPEDARRSMTRELVRDLFKGRPADLVHHLVNEHELEPGDLESLKEIIARGIGLDERKLMSG